MRFTLESDHCQAAGLHAEYMMEKLGCSAKNIYAMSQVLGRLGFSAEDTIATAIFNYIAA
jgi:hypothetical protein